MQASLQTFHPRANMALDNKVHIIAEFLRDNVITHTDLAEYLCNHFTADERRWMSRRLSDIDKCG